MDLIENLKETTLEGAVKENNDGFYFEHTIPNTNLTVQEIEKVYLQAEFILKQFQWGFRNHKFITDRNGLTLSGRISRLV